MSVVDAEGVNIPSDARLKELREHNRQKEAAFEARLEEIRQKLDCMSQDTQALAKDEQNLTKQFGEEQSADVESASVAVFARNVLAGTVESGEDRNK